MKNCFKMIDYKSSVHWTHFLKFRRFCNLICTDRVLTNMSNLTICLRLCF